MVALTGKAKNDGMPRFLLGTKGKYRDSPVKIMMNYLKLCQKQKKISMMDANIARTC